jgi:cation:H+ antiporter
MLYLQLIGGFVLLLAGGEMLVRGAVAVAQRLGVSALVIGLTLVGFGTSTPELVASLQAALAGSPGIAMGNVVGSNIANILLILGVAAVLRPVITHPTAFYRDGSVLVVASVIMAGIATTGLIGRPAGMIMVVLLIGYTLFTYIKEKRQPDAAATVHSLEAGAVGPVAGPLWRGALVALAGIAAVLFGAGLLVDGAITLARIAGVSEAVVGLTVVAVGTSLPELVTAVVAAIRRQGDVAFGNVIGSNIFNTLGILGVTALVEPLAVPAQILRLDIWLMLGATALGVLFAVTDWRISRREGALFLLLYGGYIALQAVQAA